MTTGDYGSDVLRLEEFDRRVRQVNDPQRVPPCPCECNSGGFCGGCGHAGCGGRR